MGVVKDENHFIVKGFMINKLNLKGIELMVYAIIYGFSQDGNCKFTGSRQYLADFTGSSKSTIDRVLKELVDKKFIIKEAITENNIIFNRYSINEDTLFKMSRGCIQNEEGGVFKMTTNNKDINNSISNNNSSSINNNNNNLLEDNYNIYDYLEVNNIYDFIENNFGRTLSPIEYEEISNWEDNELTRYAIKQTVLNGVYNLKYIATILNNYKKNNITSVQQAQEQEKKFKEKVSNKKEEKSMTATEKRQEMYKRMEEKYKNGDTRNNQNNGEN